MIVSITLYSQRRGFNWSCI